MAGFLTYDPYIGGNNNMRLNFESVACLAHVLNRRLVIPHSRYRQGHEPEEFGTAYRPLHPSHTMDISGVDSVGESELTPSMSRFEIQPYGKDGKIIPLLRLPDISSFACGRGEIEIPYGKRYVDVIHVPEVLTQFYSLIFTTAEAMAEMRDYVRTNIRHHKVIEHSARNIAAQIMPFHAIAVRRGDYKIAYPARIIDANLIAQEMLLDIQPGTTVVVATDETDDSWFDPIRRHFNVLLARDLINVSGAPADWSQYQLSCVEQNLCAFGETFMGTKWSTFSSYITRLRGYHNTPDQRVRFTDGTHRRIRDTDGWPKYSWEPWLRHGEPMWGREFREGWM